MSAVVEAPLASAMVLLTLPAMPTEAPAWADSGLTFDERDQGGTAGICWRRTVETEIGPLFVSQWVFVEHDGTVNVSPAFWDSHAAEFELTAWECRAMSNAMLRVARYVDQADRDALAIAAAMGDPWVTTTEAAKRTCTTGREIRSQVGDGALAAVKIGSVTYVRAADLPRCTTGATRAADLPQAGDR